MVRWFRLFGNQYLGFWIPGLVFFALQEIPYMVMPLFKLETNPIMDMPETSAALDVCEKLLGVACIIWMTFLVRGDAKLFSIAEGRERLYFSIALGVLLLNYFGWFLYFTGHQSKTVMLLFLAALPPLYYVFIGLWRGNTALALTGSVFLIVHFVHVSSNVSF